MESGKPSPGAQCRRVLDTTRRIGGKLRSLFTVRRTPWRRGEALGIDEVIITYRGCPSDHHEYQALCDGYRSPSGRYLPGPSEMLAEVPVDLNSCMSMLTRNGPGDREVVLSSRGFQHRFRTVEFERLVANGWGGACDRRHERDSALHMCMIASNRPGDESSRPPSASSRPPTASS